MTKTGRKTKAIENKKVHISMTISPQLYEFARISGNVTEFFECAGRLVMNSSRNEPNDVLESLKTLMGLSDVFSAIDVRTCDFSLQFEHNIGMKRIF